jgi:hypothetical protein
MNVSFATATEIILLTLVEQAEIKQLCPPAS